MKKRIGTVPIDEVIEWLHLQPTIEAVWAKEAVEALRDRLAELENECETRCGEQYSAEAKITDLEAALAKAMDYGDSADTVIEMQNAYIEEYEVRLHAPDYEVPEGLHGDDALAWLNARIDEDHRRQERRIAELEARPCMYEQALTKIVELEAECDRNDKINMELIGKVKELEAQLAMMQNKNDHLRGREAELEREVDGERDALMQVADLFGIEHDDSHVVADLIHAKITELEAALRPGGMERTWRDIVDDLLANRILPEWREDYHSFWEFVADVLSLSDAQDETARCICRALGRNARDGEVIKAGIRSSTP